MPSFKYQARSPDGRMLTGVIEAFDLRSAGEELEGRQYEVLSLENYGGVESLMQSLNQMLNTISSKEMVAAIRMLSVMVSASVPIMDSMRNISKQSKNPRFKAILLDIANEVEGGSKFSDALDRYPNVFSQFFINMIRSGETTGQLAEVLNYLADQQEKDYEMYSKLKGALMYPIIILTGMVIAGFVMMVYVVPKMTQVLTESGIELPLPTKILIGTSAFLVDYWWIVIIGAFVFGVSFFYWIRTDYGRFIWHSLLLRLPIVGRLLKEMYVTRYCQAMYTLMKGGLTMVQALEITSAVLSNVVWKKIVLDTIQEVNDGNAVTTVMQKNPKVVPTLVTQMLAIGEETGRMEDVLRRVGDFYARSVADMTANMMTLLEPVIMIILGIGVGGMVSAIMIPMFKMSSAV